ADVPQVVAVGDGRVYRRAAGELLHPEREPRDVLDQLKIDMGSHTFSAQYQQQPVPPEGALIQWSWFRTYARAPERRPGDRIVQSWDTASKASATNDFSVCTTWMIRDNDYYLLDVLRGRFEYPELRRRIRPHAEAHRASRVLIEDAGSGMHLI